MRSYLETKNLTKVYGQREAAKDVNLHIRKGEIYGLIGRNGAGKTTIMRMLSGLSVPTRGSYSLFGKTGPELGKMLRYVGVLIEHPGIYPRLSAYENLKIKCYAVGKNPKGYVEELLRTVGLENTDKKKAAGSYSLGMRQRLGIALALVGDPRLIILDEPINGLDPQGIVEVREILAKLPCDDDFNKAVEQVETFTIAHPDLDMWFFAGGWPLMVEVDSLPEFAKWHEGEGHYCISFDAFPPMEAFFDAGLCDGCCGQYYYKMGEMTVTYLYNLIKGEALPEPDLELGESKTPWFSTGTLAIRPAEYKEIFGAMTPW